MALEISRNTQRALAGLAVLVGIPCLLFFLGSIWGFLSQDVSTPQERDEYHSANPAMGDISRKISMLSAFSSPDETTAYQVAAKRIVANEIVLAKEDGSIRMKLEADTEDFGGGPRIVMFDTSGNVAFDIRCYIDANVLEIKSPKSDDEVEVSASKIGGGITIWQGPTAAHWRTPPVEK